MPSAVDIVRTQFLSEHETNRAAILLVSWALLNSFKKNCVCVCCVVFACGSLRVCVYLSGAKRLEGIFSPRSLV